MTLRSRLSLAFLLVVIVPLGVAAIAVGRGVPNALDSAARGRLAASRAGAVALLQELCDGARLAAEVLGREAVAMPAGQAAADVVARGLAGYDVVTNGAGSVLARAGRLARGGQPLPSDLGSCSRGLASRDDLAVIADAVTVRSGSRAVEAAVATEVDDSGVQRIASATNAGVTLVSGNQLIASTQSQSIARQLAAAAPGLPPDGRATRSGEQLVSAAGIGPTRLVLVLSVGRPGDEDLEALIVSVLAGALLLSALIGWQLARVTTRPLAELSEAASRVAGGDLQTKIDVRSQDEVGRLAAAFNEMTAELRNHVGALESSRDQLRRNLARLGETLSSTHDLGRILDVILDTAVDTVRSSAGAILVKSADREELQVRASRGLLGRDVPAAGPLPVEETVTATLISVPLRTAGGVLGVLNLYDRVDGQPFDDGDLETIRTFATQAAVALDNVLLHEEAQRLSVTDGLTGLANYRFLQQALVREIERATRFDRPFALLMLDLDRFKSVNDTYGHQVGDAVLIEIAERLRALVREVDVAARYGGEEFVVVLPETDLDGAEHSAERICQRVRQQPVVVDDTLLSITVSIGVAVFPHNGPTAAALVRAADQALYAAKSAGRDGWRAAPAR